MHYICVTEEMTSHRRALDGQPKSYLVVTMFTARGSTAFDIVLSA